MVSDLPRLHRAFVKAHTMTELSGLEITLLSKYSHQNTIQEVSFKGILIGSNCF